MSFAYFLNVLEILQIFLTLSPTPLVNFLQKNSYKSVHTLLQHFASVIIAYIDKWVLFNTTLFFLNLNTCQTITFA
jgi:hypothetical protein